MTLILARYAQIKACAATRDQDADPSSKICAGFDKSCPGYLNESARFQRPTTPVIASSVQRGIHPESHFRARTPGPPPGGNTARCARNSQRVTDWAANSNRRAQQKWEDRLNGLKRTQVSCPRLITEVNAATNTFTGNVCNRGLDSQAS